MAVNVRQELTDSRTRAISLARAITRGAGFRIRSGRTETFLARLAALELLVAGAPVVKRLTTFPGIGPITATAYVAALDNVARFERAAR